MISVKPLDNSLAEHYESFLLARPETLLYQSWRYQNLLVDLLGCQQRGLVALDGKNNVLAALPLMAMDGPFGVVLNSLPFFGSNGALIGENSEALRALKIAYRDILSSPDLAASTLIENPFVPGGTDGLAYDFIDERIGQITPLFLERDLKQALIMSFHQKTRNLIRKAWKLGVEVSVDEDSMDFLVSVHQENMREIGGLAKPKLFFDAIPRHFRSGQDYRLYVARLNGEKVAAVLVFFYNRTVEYYTPVVRKEYRASQALSAAIFRAMCDAAEQGYGWWNWGGTWLSQGGVHHFKSRWGTLDRSYRYFTSVHNPEILKASRVELLSAYPSFFTVPFSELKNCRDV